MLYKVLLDLVYEYAVCKHHHTAYCPICEKIGVHPNEFRWVKYYSAFLARKTSFEHHIKSMIKSNKMNGLTMFDTVNHENLLEITSCAYAHADHCTSKYPQRCHDCIYSAFYLKQLLFRGTI